MPKLRIAYFTPLPPQASGIADHSAELLPHLAPLADVDVVVAAGAPCSEELRERFRILPPDAYLQEHAGYDAAVFQLGNDRLHAYMIPCMRASPGIVALQDYGLHYLVLALTLGRGELKTLERALEPSYGDRSRKLALKLLLGLTDPAGFSFAEPFVSASRGLIVHSQHLLDLVRRQAPDKPVRNITLGATVDARLEPKAELRLRHGYRADDFIVASVSTRAPKKRLDVVLEAIRAARASIPGIRFVVVGGGSPGAKVYRSIREFGLSDVVEQTGWVEPERYRQLLRLADVAVDLRNTTGGETAHSALRALAAGTPVVVSASGPFLDLPDDCCPKLASGPHQATALARVLESLHRDPERLRTLSETAAAYARSKLSLSLEASEMVDFVRDVVSTTQRNARPVALLEPETVRGRPALAALYNVCRTAYLVRSYGVSDSLRRLRLNLAAAFGSRGREAL